MVLKKFLVMARNRSRCQLSPPKVDGNIVFAFQGTEIFGSQQKVLSCAGSGPNSSLQLLGALLRVQVRYKIQVPGMDCAPCSETVVWMPAPPTLSYSL